MGGRPADVTADEIHRVMDAIDPSLLGLCLDTGHARFGGTDPVELANIYKDLIRHVHIKDCKVGIMDDVKREGKGLEEALARGVFCELGDGDSGIGDGDVVLVPAGYHPVGAPAGYDCCYLNVMAGPNRAWHFTVDPDHAWLMNWDPAAPQPSGPEGASR